MNAAYCYTASGMGVVLPTVVDDKPRLGKSCHDALTVRSTEKERKNYIAFSPRKPLFWILSVMASANRQKEVFFLFVSSTSLRVNMDASGRPLFFFPQHASSPRSKPFGILLAVPFFHFPYLHMTKRRAARNALHVSAMLPGIG